MQMLINEHQKNVLRKNMFTLHIISWWYNLRCNRYQKQKKKIVYKFHLLLNIGIT